VTASSGHVPSTLVDRISPSIGRTGCSGEKVVSPPRRRCRVTLVARVIEHPLPWSARAPRPAAPREHSAYQLKDERDGGRVTRAGPLQRDVSGCWATSSVA